VPNDELEMIPALKKISSLAIFPIIGMIFHPAYILINTVILGQMEDSNTMLAAFGLGGVTIGLFLLSVGVTFSGALDTLIS
jgi:Na+-driven multidrug efflux pump